MKKAFLGILSFLLTLAGVNAGYADWTYQLGNLDLTSLGDNAWLYTSDAWAITTDGNTATIRGFSGTYDGGTIPSWVGPYPVTSIGYAAFSGQSLMSLNIPESITNIEDGAFANSSISITVDDANPCYLSANGGLFNKSQTELVSVQSYYPLNSHWIPTNVTCIRSCAFASVHMNEIFIPSSVTNIGTNAFGGRDDLGLYSIVVDPANPCFSSLDGVLFDKSQTTLIQVPPARFTNYTVPESVTRIGDCAFIGCRGLAQVTIPKSVTNIGAYVFSGCPAFITVDPANVRYSAPGGALFDNQEAALIRYSPKSPESAYSLPTNTTRIESTAFSGCSQLTSITIPNSVTNIGDNAFNSCTSLTHLALPEELREIGNLGFCGCSGLTNMVIPDKVTKIGNCAFFGCSSLASITLSTNLTGIRNATFGNCSSLKSLTLPNSVTSIGNLAFEYCFCLTNFIVDANVTNLESYAFWFSTNLTKVYFRGDAPLHFEQSAFDHTQATVYYRPERAGWGGSFFFTRAPWPSISVQNTPSGWGLTWKQGLLMESTDLQTWITNTNPSPCLIRQDQPQKFYQLKLD